MNAPKWSDKELEKLRAIAKKKPDYITDKEQARRVASLFKGKSIDAIRFKLASFRTVAEKTSPKILLMDIETLPIEAKVWDVWNVNISPDKIMKDWSIACWSAKWLFSDEVIGQVVTPKEAIERTEASILPTIWELLNEADVVITHNGNNFDIKKLNTKFLIAGMPKPMYYKSVDTLKVAKENFAFTFNKMDWINQILGIGTKIETSFKWWDEASEGNKKYLDMMLEYNKHDVNILEELYLRMRPWIAGHPNMAIYSVHGKVPACPACGSLDIHWSGKYATALSLNRGFRCQDCGAIGRSTKKSYKMGAAVTQ